MVDSWNKVKPQDDYQFQFEEILLATGSISMHHTLN